MDGHPGPELLDELFVLADVLIQLVAMVVVISQRRVDIGEGQGGVLGDDLVRAHGQGACQMATSSHCDAVTGDAGLAAAGPWGRDDAVPRLGLSLGVSLVLGSMGVILPQKAARRDSTLPLRVNDSLPGRAFS